MTSVNTNAAAITALRTLQQTNNQLDATQSRISTGLRIGEAKDNAAYWAISTTLKSDNKSLGTVKDALGLGAATVDVAYQGLNKAKDVLDEIKSKLTAATQPGVDKNVIQSEIGELQKQLVSIAGSSVFSGENWLSVDSSAVNYDATKKIVSSFSRDANNSVSIGTVDVAIGTVALFDSSTVKGKNGILDGAISLKGKDGRDLDLGTANADGNTSQAGLAATTGAARETGVAASTGTVINASTLGTPDSGSDAYSTRTYTGNLTVAGVYAANDTITLTIGGATATLTLDSTQAAAASLGSIALSEFSTAALSATPGFALSTTGSDLVITRSTYGSTVAAQITGGSATTADTTDSPTVTGPGAGTSVPGSTVTPGTKAAVSSAALTVSDFVSGDVVSAIINVNGTDRTITTAGLVGTGGSGAVQLSDIVGALDTAFATYGNVTADSGGVKFEATATGTVSAFTLKSLTATEANGDAKTITNGIGSAATKASFETGSFTAVTLDADDNLYLQIQVNTATAGTNITIDQALVNKTLSTGGVTVSNGAITSAADFKKVLDAALAAANVTGVTTSVTNTDKITFSSTTTGVDSKIVISDVKASAGADTITVDTLDISDAGLAKVGATTGENITKVLSAYISAVNTAINKVTTAASNLGAVASRIDMQKSFVNTLMDTIDKGVGNLIDADMSEESTKLQALQVKQQLGVQALSIANQSSQNILSLFRG